MVSTFISDFVNFVARKHANYTQYEEFFLCANQSEWNFNTDPDSNPQHLADAINHLNQAKFRGYNDSGFDELIEAVRQLKECAHSEREKMARLNQSIKEGLVGMDKYGQTKEIDVLRKDSLPVFALKSNPKPKKHVLKPLLELEAPPSKKPCSPSALSKPALSDQELAKISCFAREMSKSFIKDGVIRAIVRELRWCKCHRPDDVIGTVKSARPNGSQNFVEKLVDFLKENFEPYADILSAWNPHSLKKKPRQFGGDEFKIMADFLQLNIQIIERDKSTQIIEPIRLSTETIQLQKQLDGSFLALTHQSYPTPWYAVKLSVDSTLVDTSCKMTPR